MLHRTADSEKLNIRRREMDEISRLGENQTMAEPIEITKSRQIVKMETRLRLYTCEKYARWRIRLTGGPKMDAARIWSNELMMHDQTRNNM